MPTGRRLRQRGRFVHTDVRATPCNEDAVGWCTLGVTHRTRPEDWPVLPVEIASFELAPEGFFDENPTIDVPPEPAACESDAVADDD